mmetsp:Transcript_32516/g.68358  ORF Transcript_32516/g.68358 Transcript_32516/m.68358 type:complete len:746 (+) Transcript_32516:159-2396(+)|eukprot:CAMPEP_0172300786 /NCGR_PEP_ID=MMETSP1058-20130122/2794_1 /TAXON_ID=83371 /ORGANISM="Detonula confervacea, Strain CCMP 353" /LENGTH=745 /DNA_ID=CAMNT_0013010677 /DNA_START=134 /DNA_END=2371 /DNA_ORIENTATION=-
MKGNMSSSSSSNNSIAYSINLDNGGMDAIMGSLFGKEGDIMRSSRSFHGEPSSERSQPISRRRSVASFYEPTRTSKQSSKLSEPIQPAMRSRFPRPRRRGTVDSMGSFGNESPKFSRRASCINDQKFIVKTKTAELRVSWSNLRSVSLIDLEKSPDAHTKLNDDWQETMFPSLPLGTEGGPSSSSLGVNPPSENLSATHEQHLPRRRHRQAHPNPQDEEANPQDTQQQTHRPTTRVICLPWTDHRGIQGEYTGEVNSAIQPNGIGTFTTNGDGSSFSCTWRNGMLVHSVKVPSSPGTHTSGQSGSSNSDGDETKYSSTQSIKYPMSTTTSIPGYQLGHPAKHRSHMQIAKNASSLKTLDFAFVLRSNGEWTYSIVADKPLSDVGPLIRFVLDNKGNTKTIRKKYWEKGIRLVNTGLVNVDGSINVVDAQQEDDLGPDRREKTGEQSGKGIKVPKKKNRRATLENHPSRKSIKGPVTEDPISKKLNRRKSNGANSRQDFMSFTSDKAVIDSFTRGSVGDPDGGWYDKETPEAEKLHRAHEKNADESERSGSTLGEGIKALLSLEYLGTLDDQSSRVERGRQQRRNSSSFYQGDSFMKSNSSVRRSSSYAGSSTRNHQGGQQESKSHNKSLWGDPSAKSNSSLHSTSFPSINDHHEGGILKRSSSFYNVACYDNESKATKVTKRRGSSASLQDMIPLGGDRKMKRRVSDNSIGTNAANLSALLREIYSPHYPLKSSSSNSLATNCPN